MYRHYDQSLITFLRSLADIPDAEMAKAVDLFRPMRLRRGAFFMQAGDIPQSIGFLVSGVMRLYYMDEHGREYTKSFCVPPDVVSAYSALLLGVPSRLFIDALEDSVLLMAPYDAFVSLAAMHVCWEVAQRKIAERLFIKKEQRESTLLLDDAQTRYLAFLDQYPGLEQRVKQYHIASYLGITPVSLSRIRAQLPKS
jgi:CRP-like cAMP-binding protein